MTELGAGCEISIRAQPFDSAQGVARGAGTMEAKPRLRAMTSTKRRSPKVQPYGWLQPLLEQLQYPLVPADTVGDAGFALMQKFVFVFKVPFVRRN